MKSYAASNAILNLIYRAVAWANVADNAASSPITSIDVALHTGIIAPGDAQSVNEATFGAYARKVIPRNGSEWSAAALGSLSQVNLAQFLECTSGTNVITHVSTGYGGIVLHAGALASSRTISTGIRPQFAANQLVITES